MLNEAIAWTIFAVWISLVILVFLQSRTTRLRQFTLILLGLLGFAYMAIWASSHGLFTRTPFDPIGWRDTELNSEGRTARSAMVADLLRQYDFSGWSRTEVIELLGPPTKQSAGFEQWDLVYVLGLERGGWASLDEEALGFKFDEKDNVIEYGTSVN